MTETDGTLPQCTKMAYVLEVLIVPSLILRTFVIHSYPAFIYYLDALLLGYKF